MCFTHWDKISWNEQLSKKLQTYNHTAICRKKGGARGYNAPWASSDKTKIVYSKEKIDETMVKQSKKFIKKVLSYICYNKWLVWCHTIRNFERVCSYSRTVWQSIRIVEKNVSILYKRKLCEVNRAIWCCYFKAFKVLYELAIRHNCICNAYTPIVIFMESWTYNEQTYEKGIKGGLCKRY